MKCAVVREFGQPLVIEDPIDAAPLSCAGVTRYKAVKVGNVRSGDLVAISGIGGLGHLALR
jgi:propanol-preferring alcohol dehydrogenase